MRAAVPRPVRPWNDATTGRGSTGVSPGGCAGLTLRASLALLCIAASAHASTRVVITPAAGLSVRAWTTDDGLPAGSVTALAQTVDGYLWIGTREGLARFDGVRFVVYDQRTRPDWSSDAINALCAAADGSLWVGFTDAGLKRFSGGRFHDIDVPSASVRTLHESHDGTLWIATDRGVGRLKDGRFLAGPPILAAVDVYAIREDDDGRVWLGTSDGLYVYKQGEYSAAGVSLGLGRPTINVISRGSDGTLYIGTTHDGLFRVRQARAERIGEDVPIRSVLEDRRGTVWVASDDGLRRANESTLEHALTQHGLSGFIVSLFEDREGSVWVGTRYDGLVRLTASRAESVGHELRHPSVLTVLEDRQGGLWFGMAGGGLGRLAGGQLDSFGVRDGLSSDAIGALFEDRLGRLWFGPRASNTLHRLEHGRVRSLPFRGAAASFYEDAEGALWVGTTDDGLYRLRAGESTQWTTENGLPSRAVRTIVGDGEGGLWLGTPRGLVRFRERPLALYTTAQGLQSDRIRALHREPNGPLWVGTSRGGLARFEGGRFTNYGPAQGLCDDQVLSILDDRAGNLWMSSRRGIFHVSKEDLEAVARGVRTSVSCTAYGRADGMESAQCSGGYQPSAWRGRDGRLWFPTEKGLAVIDPRRVHHPNGVPPPVWIETVEADGQVMPLSERGRLPAGTRRVELAYTALSLVAPEKVRFRHRLSGFDTAWVDGGSQRRISYTNLAPGTYTFHVIASNNDGVWNEKGHQWTFTVRPFFYQTTWFYGTAALLTVGLGFALHSLRVRDLRLRNAVFAERAHLSHEIHDHVSQIMTGVALQLDAASQTLARGDGSCGAYIDRASRLARQGIEETRVILRSLQRGHAPQAPTHTPLDAAVIESVAGMVEGTGVRLQARTHGEPFAVRADVEHTLVRIGQEAVTNALRHGHAKTVDIVITFERHGLRVTISDDGRGFEPSAVARDSLEGFGLAGMAERVAEQRGTFEVLSRQGSGTTVAAFFPRHECAGDP